MSESYYGAFCRGCGEMTAVSGFTDGEMVMLFPTWKHGKIQSGRDVRRLLQSEISKCGPCKCGVTRTFTDAELERLIAVACREQRYKCVDAIKVQENFCTHHTFSGIAQNTPAPTLEQVMEKYKELNIENE